VAALQRHNHHVVTSFISESFVFLHENSRRLAPKHLEKLGIILAQVKQAGDKQEVAAYFTRRFGNNITKRYSFWRTQSVASRVVLLKLY